MLWLSFDVTIYFLTMSSCHYKDCKGSDVCSRSEQHAFIFGVNSDSY